MSNANVETIAQKIKERIQNCPDSSALESMIQDIAQLWEIAPAIARRLENNLVEFLDQNTH